MKWLSGALLLSACACVPLSARGAERHLIVIGVDGLYPKGIEAAKTPNIHAMMKDGSWSFHARAVFPTVSSPNWASMIMGAPVEMTGVIGNDWQPKGAAITPACEDAPGIFPTIFGIEHQQHPAAKAGIFTDWPDFVRLVEPNIVDTVFTTDEPEDPVLEHALAYFRGERPELLFIHFDLVDHAGHKRGWGSPEYIAAVEKTDRMVGQIRALVQSMGIERSTNILLTADHGGTGRSHGGLTMAETEIPWILAGNHVLKDHELTAPIMQYDTAATMAYILGLRPDACWRGQAVRSAFQGK
jgi:predicted AlkP superfamily pyrophosphatase or phosphodiesterase